MIEAFGRLRASRTAALAAFFCARLRAAPPAEDIRDIRGPKFLPPDWVLPAVIAGAVFAGVALYVFWRLRRRRRMPVLLPHEAALRRLEEIRALMQPASVREFSIAVSDIIRRYIEQRFAVTATRQTTEEFLRGLLLNTNESLARHQGLLSEFLQECDFVKFAALSLTLNHMDTLRQSARAFVLRTVEEQPAVPAGQAHDSLPAT